MGKEILSNIETVNLSGKHTCEEVLTLLGQKAIDKGWAKEGYVEALLAREAEFSTGLHASVDIAIPHADAIWANEPAIVMAFLDEPSEFQPMGGAGGVVPAKIIFMLVIKDNSSHIDFLRAISGFISSGNYLPELYEGKDVSFLMDYLEKNM